MKVNEIRAQQTEGAKPTLTDLIYALRNGEEDYGFTVEELLSLSKTIKGTWTPQFSAAPPIWAEHFDANYPLGDISGDGKSVQLAFIPDEDDGVYMAGVRSGRIDVDWDSGSEFGFVVSNLNKIAYGVGLGAAHVAGSEAYGSGLASAFLAFMPKEMTGEDFDSVVCTDFMGGSFYNEDVQVVELRDPLITEFCITYQKNAGVFTIRAYHNLAPTTPFYTYELPNEINWDEALRYIQLYVVAYQAETITLIDQPEAAFSYTPMLVDGQLDLSAVTPEMRGNAYITTLAIPVMNIQAGDVIYFSLPDEALSIKKLGGGSDEGNLRGDRNEVVTADWEIENLETSFFSVRNKVEYPSSPFELPAFDFFGHTVSPWASSRKQLSGVWAYTGAIENGSLGIAASFENLSYIQDRFDANVPMHIVAGMVGYTQNQTQTLTQTCVDIEMGGVRVSKIISMLGNDNAGLRIETEYNYQTHEELKQIDIKGDVVTINGESYIRKVTKHVTPNVMPSVMVAHNLDRTDLVVTCYDVSTGKQAFLRAVETNSDTLTLYPENDAATFDGVTNYRVVIIG